MTEIIFIVGEDELDGGYFAKSLEYSICTEADEFESLKEAVKEAVNCHFDDDQKRIIRLHLVKEEVFAA